MKNNILLNGKYCKEKRFSFFVKISLIAEINFSNTCPALKTKQNEKKNFFLWKIISKHVINFHNGISGYPFSAFKTAGLTKLSKTIKQQKKTTFQALCR